MINNTAPLSSLLRPKTLDEFIGQEHILSERAPIYKAIQSGALHSLILWGPPGSGKTTLAKIMASTTDSTFIELSAITTTVKEIRQVIEDARSYKMHYQKQTILFFDEVHRFNKNQQDIFLPYIEDGTIIFIGATTENPSFEINNALLSRCHIYVLKKLEEEHIVQIIDRAIDYLADFLKKKIFLDKKYKIKIARIVSGDARQALNLIERIVENSEVKNSEITIDEETIKNVLQGKFDKTDKAGDLFYEQISALHKAVRGSDPDAALYWFARMILGGVDPLYLARRVVRMATEDIGNADPRALQLALNAWDVQKRLGSPEGELALAQAIVYLSVASKSNAVYIAYNKALKDAKTFGSEDVPIHLRNAESKLMKSLGYGKDYKYDHDHPDGFAKNQTYFPDKLVNSVYYEPVDRGLETKIKEKLKLLKQMKNS